MIDAEEPTFIVMPKVKPPDPKHASGWCSTFSAWLQVVINGLDNEHDVVIAVVGSSKHLWGPVGLGKSNVAFVLAKALSLATAKIFGRENVVPLDLDLSLVVRDDISGFERALFERTKYLVIWLDEGFWFFNKQWWSYSDVKVLTPEFVTNRKELRIWILVLDSIWHMIEFFREGGRVTWLFKCTGKGEVELWANDGTFDPDMDRYGMKVAQWNDFPRVPEGPWENDYRRRVGDHDCKRRGSKCVINLRKSGGGGSR